MKTNYLTTVLILVMSLFFASCGNNSKNSEETDHHEHHDEDGMHHDQMHDDEHHHEHEGHHEGNHDDMHSDRMIDSEKANAILQDYLKLKNALVKTDAEAAAKAAKKLAETSSDVETLSVISEQALKIANASDVAVQREYFYPLSKAIYNVVKSGKGSDAKIYKQYCPMARNNEGAFWLSTEEEIMNPYFGDKMLHCGEVQEEL